MTALRVVSSEPRRRLLEKLWDESYTTYITRCCTQHTLDAAPVISTYALLVFGGAEPPDAAKHAMWVHNVYDEQEDMKVPGQRKKRVACTIDETRLQGKQGVVVTCGECGHQTESWGTGERSVRRCLALMGQECPKDEANYYHTEREDDGENYL
jgi:hypothetical protein